MGISVEDLIPRVQVNVPFGFLVDRYLEVFLREGLNPEIGLDAHALRHYPKKVFQRVARELAQFHHEHS